MKTFVILIASFLFTLQAITQPTRLIVRADDLGSSHSANEAILKSCLQGIVTSVEVMVNTAWFPEAVKLMQENPGIDVGLHLTITSEWENIKWRPLTDCPSLVDKNGYFYPMVYANKNYPGQAILENQWKIGDIEKEFRAQIELARKNIPRISHLTAHMGCAEFAPEVSAMTLKLATEYGLHYELSGIEINYAGYDGPSGTPEEKIQSFINRISKLKPGETFLFVDHPGLDNNELRAVYHIGYEQVAFDRQGVTDLFTSEKVIDTLRQHNIQLVSYRDVLK